MKSTINGHTIRWSDGGRSHTGDDPGVVLLHGSGMNRTTWQLQTRWLAHHGYRAAALDLPGHGGTDGPLLESIADMADWVAATMDALDLAPAHLVGHSMGTFVAVETAARHPETVRSLVLLGTADSMPVHPELLTSSFDDVHHAAELMTSWGVGSRAQIGHHPTPGTWLVGGSTALVDVSPAGALGTDMAACNDYKRAVEAASEVTCPVSMILGSEDKMTPVRATGGLSESLSDLHKVVLDGVGHMIMLEAPDRARDEIAAALERAG